MSEHVVQATLREEGIGKWPAEHRTSTRAQEDVRAARDAGERPQQRAQEGAAHSRAPRRVREVTHDRALDVEAGFSQQQLELRGRELAVVPGAVSEHRV